MENSQNIKRSLSPSQIESTVAGSVDHQKILNHAFDKVTDDRIVPQYLIAPSKPPTISERPSESNWQRPNTDAQLERSRRFLDRHSATSLRALETATNCESIGRCRVVDGADGVRISAGKLAPVHASGIFTDHSAIGPI
jgi:hypothetical protein